MRSKNARMKPGNAPLRWRGLQFRMTVSYALTTVVALLVVETLLVTALVAFLTFSPFVDVKYISDARQTAKLYALAAAAQTQATTLDPRITFAPDQPYSMALSVDYFGSNTSVIKYITTRSSAVQNETVGLLIAPDGRVLASSYPAQYPVTSSVAQLLPGRYQLIMKGLSGVGGGAVQNDIVGVVEPVLSGNKKIMGVVYVQEKPSFTVYNVLQGFSGLVIVSSVFFLMLMLPVGGLFGMFTTRGLLRRLRQLGTTTTRFAEGDYTQRVKVSRHDEVGQLEQHFNQMAEQLIESMEQRQILIEQNARHAERARIEQEMHTAQNIQLALLPKDVPALPGWHFMPYYKPAKEVGGDFYDFLAFEDGRLGIVIGDVTGKGVPAALVMAITRTMLRTAAQGVSSPGEVLARVNSLLCADIPTGMFVTCFYAILDPSSGHVHYANAGHDLPYRQRSNTVSELRATGMPLGMMPGSSYEERDAMLVPGDSVLFYSDGLVEAHNTKRDMFGFPHLMALLREQPGDCVLIDFLLDELATFTGADWEQEDDVTMVVLSRQEEITGVSRQ